MAAAVGTQPVPLNSAAQQIDATEQEAPPTANILARSSLYVGDIHESVTEGMLFEKFSEIGKVHSIRVCRDAITKKSLGYAYVNFNATDDPEAAQRALDELNYTDLLGKPMRIMWSNRDPSTRRSGEGNIFIKNLDRSIDQKELHDTFDQFGTILSCKLVTDQHGKSRGYGFVHYDSGEAAQTAIKKVDGKKLRESIVFVAQFVKRTDRMQQSEQTFTNLYVKNIEAELTSETLKEQFSKFGEITNCVVMTDESGKSKGFGFVNYADAESAKKAVQELHDQETTRKNSKGDIIKLYVQRAQKKQERNELLRQQYDNRRLERYHKQIGLNLYVRNLADDIDDDELKQLFSKFGQITSSIVMRDEKEASRCFGFVCFTEKSAADAAMKEMNGFMYKNKPLYINGAQTKEVRRIQLEHKIAQSNAGQGPVLPGMYNQGMMYGRPVMPQQFYGAPYGVQGSGQMMMPRPGRGGLGRGMVYPSNIMMHMQGGGWHQGAGGPGRGMRGGMVRGKDGRPMRGGRRGYMDEQGGGYGPWGGYGQGRPYGGGRGDGKRGRSGKPREGGARGGGKDTARSGAEAGKEAASGEGENQKQTIGENLYKLISQTQPDKAAKITGMLLEMDIPELQVLIDSQQHLENKVTEALEVLRQSQQEQA